MEEDDAPSASAPAQTIFLLSFHQRDELAAAAKRAGWAAIAARRADQAERRFIASGATVAVIDARGALDEGLAAARALADPVEANAAALLLLIARGDAADIAAVFEAGATHYLEAPFSDDELAHALRFAARHAERLAGGSRAAARRADLHATEAATWRWRRGDPVVVLSPALAALIGPDVPETEALGALLRRFGRDAAHAARDAVTRLLAGAPSTAFAHRGPGGNRLAHHVSLEEGGAVVVGQVEPLDPEPPRQRTVSRDPLTGLDDREGARSWIEGRLAERGTGGGAPVLLMIAVHRFEMVNAAFGRGAGDALLQGVARRIERLAARGGSRRRLVARIAGAELAVGLPPPATVAEARFLADEIVAAVARPFVAGGDVVTLACRIGVAAPHEEDADAAALFRRASIALAEAKAIEGAPVRVLGAGEEDGAERRGRLDIELRAAVARDEVELLWQPQVAIPDGRIVGVEALARWRHPELGELGAEILFAAAERSGFLAELSEHVRRKAVAAVAAWPETLAGLRVAINVTAADVAHAGFAAGFLALVDAAGVARERITVELTESGLIADLDAAAALLGALRAGGLRVAIDDFGTGYSSLAYLKALPLDYLKIDRRLSQDIAGAPRARIVVRGVIAMARSLGLVVIAEGVEEQEQLELLGQEGCELYQGFLCAPPLDVGALERLVTGG